MVSQAGLRKPKFNEVKINCIFHCPPTGFPGLARQQAITLSEKFLRFLLSGLVASVEVDEACAILDLRETFQVFAIAKLLRKAWKSLGNILWRSILWHASRK